jgi:peptide/nickel transport system substrate-binding protein
VRRALTLAIDRWHGAPALSRISVMKTVGGVGFPGSPLAATRQELEQLAGYWPDIEKSRAEARRLLKEAGAEGLTFELLNRNVDQPYKFNALWVIDEWSKIGVKVTQRVVPTGPFGEALRRGEFDTVLDGDCQNIVNPLLDGTKYATPPTGRIAPPRPRDRRHATDTSARRRSAPPSRRGGSDCSAVHGTGGAS